MCCSLMNHSARWTRKVTFDPGLYRFTAQADDAVRIYVNGVLILTGGIEPPSHAEIGLSGEQPVVVEYIEIDGLANVKVSWKRIGGLPPTATYTPTATPTLVPSRTPSPTPSPSATPTATFTPTAQSRSTAF